MHPIATDLSVIGPVEALTGVEVDFERPAAPHSEQKFAAPVNRAPQALQKRDIG